MSADTILYGILGILTVSFLIDQILSFLNLQHHQKQLPEELKESFDSVQYARSYEYHRVNYRFGLLKSLLSFIIVFFLLWEGGFGKLNTVLSEITTHNIGLPLLYLGTLFILSDILSIPFQLYQNFVIEERFGFNKMTLRTFFLDKLKSYALVVVLMGGVLGIFLLLVNELGTQFWIWFWIFITAFMLVINMFYTTWILPLFNKLSPLENGELRQAIESYSRSVNFPLTNILVMDGSKRSNKSNAFFSGLGKQKKVVLYDTLIENHGQEELVAVLAHEIGHYKKKHIIQSMLLSILQMGLTLFILSRFIASPLLSEALGSTQYAVHLNLLAFGILYSPISSAIGILMNLFSRKNEYEADHFAATTFKAEPLQNALITLHQDNLSNLTPHPWYVFVNYSHPPLLQRVRALIKKKKNQKELSEI